ncbi:hypothetical protein IMG5_023380 [Ichthyophthirius multifiliis]|uniref:TATA-binding protein interacting (TIP20) domain-containing protein n=1 Tax=Ichthyophthirius multifiliis TaxID=5932 RepID=G0QKZ3_ICHMU|nr:hypothetical protein IMG5_023380 [Ichthyophthirius multifiliis]EGR34114.1 hypothetical protein IMG5_023380 [Ichthyophthirius multifiliis]|eukprot:XP_004039418.1 hypothetical protein IMG5_023380 [Ichthyophthirius multifiliis]
MDQKRFEELVQDAKDCDPDKKFMAANDLSNALSKYQLQAKDYDKVVSILLTQLNDESSEVQGNSIRCLSKIISKLQESQIENVAKTMIQKVIEDRGEYKDVYATCLKTLINDVPSNYAKSVQPVFLHAVTKMEQNKGEKNYEVEEELCDILNILFKKWAQVLSTQNMSMKSLTNILMNNILNIDRVSLKKKSCSCLGSLGLLLPKDEVIKTVNTLLENLKKPPLNQLYYYLKEKQIFIIHAISALSKTVSRKLGVCLKQIVQLIVSNIQEYMTGIEEYDQIIIISEMFELYLGILENLVKNSHDETKEFFNQIIDLTSELINYDPNRTAQIDDQQEMEIEQDEEDYDYYSEDQDSDECSWRVRRASLQLIETLVKSDSELIKYIFEKCISQNTQKNIIQRLMEKYENIRFANFQCLQTVIKSIVISDGNQDKIEDEDLDFGQTLFLVRVKSSEIQTIFPQILSRLKSSDIDQEIKQSVLSCSSSLLLNVHLNLNVQQLEEVFSAVSEKIKSETKKIPVLKLIKKVPVSITSQIQSSSTILATLNKISLDISDFLQKQDRSLRVSSLEALENSQIVSSTSSFNSLYDVFGELSAKNVLNRKQCIDKLYENSNKDSLNSISKAICAIILQSTENDFLDFLCTSACNINENSLKRQVSLYTLGELGRHINLCNVNNILSKVEEIVNNNKNNNEDIRIAASLALGGIAFGNLEQVLPQVIQTINIGQEGQYLMLNALKYTTASSFKYFCVKNVKVENEIKELTFELLENIQDSNFRTRAAILKSLNVIAYNIPQAILPHVSKQEFFLPLQKSLKLFQVKEIDFGPFKQKNDEAEPVRNAAFSLVDTAIDHLHYRGVENFEREIIQEALDQFACESSEDIKILRFQIIKKLALKVPLKVTPFLDNISEVFLNVLKPYASKSDGDRAADMIRIGLKTVVTLKNIAEDENNQKYIQFWELVMKTEKFKNIINQMFN